MTKSVITSLWVSLLCFVASFSATAQQDCNLPSISMSCQNLVHLSLDQTCSKTILPQDMLAGNFTCYNTFSVQILNTTLGNTVGKNEIGKTFNVKVLHSVSGNSCWGKIKVEDKLPPAITCPADATVACWTPNLQVSLFEKIVFDNVPNNGVADTSYTVFGQPTVNENCSGYTLSYMDNLEDKDCNTAGVSAILTRTWKAKDAYNNVSTCKVVYTLSRETLATLTFPKDTAIECSANYAKDSKGRPHPSYAGAPTLGGQPVFPTLAGYCEASASYQDQITASCGTTYKVLRKWTVIDWCTSQVIQHTQVVKIVDTQSPIIGTLPTNVTISTDGNTCKKAVYIPTNPTITDNCSTTFTYFYTLYETSGPWTVAKGDTLRNLNIGTYVLEYKVTDHCGNTATATQFLTIEDGVPPSAVCDLNTKVTLTNDGTAIVEAKTFDDGSVDNCAVDTSRFEVKRLGAPDTDYAKTIKFSCSDDKLQVMLRVWDYGYLSNTCTVNVDVDDKNAPLLFAQNGTVACAHEPEAKAWLDAHRPTLLQYPDLPSATNPGFYDNCGASLNIIKEENKIDVCGNGTFTRTWEATDAAGNKTTALQTVSSVNRSAYKVTFPADKAITCGTANIDFSPKVNGEPKIEDLGSTCPLVSVSYIDEKFSTANDACYKIIRRWRILNECENSGLNNPDKGEEFKSKKADGTCNAATPRCYVNIGNSIVYDATMSDFVSNYNCFDYDTDGFMEYIQVLKVIDEKKPEIGNIEVEIEDNASGDCNAGGNINIKKVEVKDCSDTLGITFTSNIPNYSAGKLPTKLTNVPYGKYKMTINVTDFCGNFESKEIDIEVKEQKKPTPVCKDNIAVALMPDGMVMIPAILINANSFDNCTPKNKLKYRLQIPAPGAGATFSTSATDTMVTLSCSNIKAGETSGFVTVALWVGDEAGNWDYCETFIVIQDNGGGCTNNTPVQMKLSGIIKTANADGVEDVTMKLEGDANVVTGTDKQGFFQFNSVTTKKDYHLTPSKNIDPLNGVSTLDLVFISKHILGTTPLTTMYQALAADVNNSGTISTADIVELRKMILGLQKDFSKNTSWRFVEKGKSYDPINTAWITTLPNKKAYFNLQPTEAIADFIAVKVGDVNGNAKASNAQGNAGTRNDNITYFEADKNALKAGDIVTVNFSTLQKLQGFQFTMNFDKNALELVGIQGNKENFAILEEGVITTSHADNINGEKLFAMTFKAKKDNQLSQSITLNSSVTNNESYDLDGNASTVALDFKGSSEPTAFALYQNQPNPFSNSTTISFQLPKTETATIVVTDLGGRTLKEIKGTFEKGQNTITIDKNELGSAGVYYYHLRTANSNATRKMIIVE
jgi:Secretion system C-terminal sorting domain